MKSRMTKHQWFLIYLACITALNFLCAIFIIPIDDEMYYWQWGKHLDFGYFDHPPMVALMTFLSDCIGEGYLDIRLFTVVFFTGFVGVLKQIVKPKSNKEMKIFFVLLLSIVGFQLFGFITTPDMPFLIFGSLYLLFLKKCLETSSWRNFIGLAFCMALVMYSKYFGVLLISFSVLPLVSKWWKSPPFYFAIVLSLLLYSPHLWWEYQNDWVSLQYHFMGRARQNNFSILKMLNYVLGLIGFGSLVFWTIPLRFYTKLKKNDFYLSLITIASLSLVFFFSISWFLHTQAQWNLLIYLSLFILSFEYLRKQLLKNWRFKLSLFFTTILILMKFVLIFNLFPTPMSEMYAFIKSSQQKTAFTPAFERYQQTAAYQYFTREKAFCYRVYNHRFSQYDLWKDEEHMQHQNISFLGLEKTSKDSIQDNYSKTQYIKNITDFQSFPKLEFAAIDATYRKDTLYLKCQLYNPYPYSIDLQKTKQELILIGFNQKGFPNSVQTLSDTLLLPKEISSLRFSEKIRFPNILKKFSIGMRPKGISGKKQSPYFEIQKL